MIMKKTLLLFVALVASIGAAWADKTVYLDPASFDSSSNWTNDNAKFAVWAWSTDDDGAWYHMSAIEGTDYYSTSIPDEKTNVIIGRYTGESIESNWSNVYNRAINITLTGNTLVKITGWENGDTYWENDKNNTTSGYTTYAATESATTYTVNLITNTWDAPKAYAFGNNNFTVFGAWSGTAMTDAGTETINGTSYKKWSVSSKQPVAPTGLIFNDGGSNQTIDLPFVNNRTYYWGVTGATGSTDANVAEDAIAFIGTNNVSNILNNTGAQPNSYDNDGNMNIVVDLGPTQTVDGFSITFSGDRWVSEFDLSYSTDGFSYTAIGTFTTGISENTTTTVTGSFATPVTAKYIKYTSKRSNKNATDDNYSETIRNFQLIQYASDALVISSLTADPSEVTKGVATEITFTAKNSQDINLSTYGSRVSVAYTITAGEGTLVGNTLTATSASVTITATATDVIANTTSTATTTITCAFAPATLATEPTADAENVIAIWSEHYSRVDEDNNAAWGGGPDPLWISKNIVTISDHKVMHVKGTGYGSRPATATTNDYSKAFVALYPKSATSGKLYADGAYADAQTFTLTPEQWNYVEVPFGKATNYVMVELVGETEFYLDNFYVTKPAAGAVEVTVNNGVATVTGALTADNVSEVNAATAASLFDLRGATVTGTPTINNGNANALILLSQDYSVNPLGNTTNVLYYKQNAYNVPLTNINWTDGDGDIYTFGTVNGAGAGKDVTYTRSIAAGKYATITLPVAVTLPENVNAYELSTYSSGTVTLTKAESFAANTPYIIHNAGASAAEITFTSSNADLTFGTSAASNSGATFTGTYNKVAADGSQFVIQNGQLVKANEGVTIGAFRAYFTGLSASGARLSFIDDETTGINAIENVENNVKMYDLQGRRVAAPQKGLYIVNGKKVLVK